MWQRYARKGKDTGAQSVGVCVWSQQPVQYNEHPPSRCRLLAKQLLSQPLLGFRVGYYCLSACEWEGGCKQTAVAVAAGSRVKRLLANHPTAQSLATAGAQCTQTACLHVCDSSACVSFCSLLLLLRAD